jgi:PPOX class probable F420-dependent enzyme
MDESTIPSSHRDLLDAPVLVLATLERGGSPQLSSVWFLAEDDLIRISLNTTRHKLANLQRNPTCSVLIADQANPYRYLEIRGRADIRPDDDYAFADRLGGKYRADLRDMDGSGESRVVVTVVPSRIRVWG